MAAQQANTRFGLHHLATSLILACFILHCTSGFSTDRSDSEVHNRVKREQPRSVYPGYNTLCQANARNCVPTVIKKSPNENQWRKSKTVFGEPNGQNIASDDVLYYLLSLAETIKRKSDILCKANTRNQDLCDEDSQPSSIKRMLKRFLQVDNSQFGLPEAQFGQENQAKEQAVDTSDLVTKLQASISNWKLKNLRLREKDSTADFPKLEKDAEYFEPW